MTKHSDDFLRIANEARLRIKEVDPKDALMLSQQGAVIIDVREKEEFETQHIDGATHVSRGTLEMRINEVVPHKDTPIVCYCGGGNRGALAADTLQKMGFTNVVSIEGGLNAFLKKTEG